MALALHVVNALIRRRKSEAYETVTDAHRRMSKPDLVLGIRRSYQPKDDDGQQLPPESKLVQERVGHRLAAVADSAQKYLSMQLAQDIGNQAARADIFVDSETPLLRDVPVAFLLTLEKWLADLRTFVDGLPTLDPAEQRTYNPQSEVWESAPTATIRTTKVMRNHVLAEATDRHPAQVTTYTEDVPAGTWTTVKMSGAVPNTEKRAMLYRIEELAEAVKAAREKANLAEVSTESFDVAPILARVFG